MTVEEAKREFPQWAMVSVGGPRRIIEDTEWTDVETEPKVEWKLPISDRARAFWKKHMILIAVCLFLPLWTAGACWITASIVRHNTVNDQTHTARAQMQTMQERIDVLENMVVKQNNGEKLGEVEREILREITGQNLLTGEASKQAAMEADADYLAKLAGPYATKRMQRSVIWNALVRKANPNYPNTIEEVVNQPKQWMFYKDTNPIKADVREMALEELKLFYEGRYPAGLSNDYVYGEWSATDYVLRDRWEKDSRTNYWRYPE